MPVNNNTSHTPLTRMAAKSICPPKSPKPVLIASIPKKISAIPIKTRPNPLNLPLKKPAKIPKISIGTAAGDKLTLCPATANNQIPLVAPKFVPKITAIPPAKPIMPALKNAMVSKETSVLDCNTNVAPIPNNKPFTGVAVLLPIKRSNVPPAAWFKPSSMLCIPNKNKAKP